MVPMLALVPIVGTLRLVTGATWLAFAACTAEGGGEDGAPATDGIALPTSDGSGAQSTGTGGEGEDDGAGVTGSSTAPAPGSEDGAPTGGVDSTGPSNDDDPGPVLSFAPDLYDPIIAPRCSCHVAGVAGGLPMPDAATAFENLVNGMGESGLPLVVAGDASMSYLAAKVQGEHVEFGGDTGQMPLGGTLTADEIGTFAQWIDTGALP